MVKRILHLRAATIDDSDAVVRLNQESVAVTSQMDRDQYRKLLAISDFAFVVVINGQMVGFLLAIGENQNYDNANYRWFANRLKQFLYIDRVVIDETKRGAGLGSALYTHLFTYSRDRLTPQLTAEIDIEPPNLASLAFHDRHGFVELGTRILDNGKLVSMRVKIFEAHLADAKPSGDENAPKPTKPQSEAHSK